MSKSITESPIDDLTYDVLTVLQKKAKALEAYDKYVRDAQGENDEELEDLFKQMRKQDQDDVSALKEILARRLDEDLGYEDDGSDEEDEEAEDYENDAASDHADADAADASAPQVGTSPRPPPRRGESTQRHR